MTSPQAEVFGSHIRLCEWNKTVERLCDALRVKAHGVDCPKPVPVSEDADVIAADSKLSDQGTLGEIAVPIVPQAAFDSLFRSSAPRAAKGRRKGE